MKKKIFFSMMMLATFPIFSLNVRADELKTLSLSEKPWVFRGNSGGVSVEKEITADVDGDFYAVYFNNSNSVPVTTILNDGVTNLRRFVNSDASEVKTMTFKGAFDITSADEYSVEYYDLEVEDESTWISLKQNIDVNCQEGIAFYQVYEGDESIHSGGSRIKEGKVEISTSLYDIQNVNPSELSVKVYGILQTDLYDVSDFSVEELSHELDETTYRGSFVVKVPEQCTGILDVDIMYNNEAVGTSKLWIDNVSEVNGEISVYNADIENIEGYEYRIRTFAPIDYRIDDYVVAFDGSYEYPHWTFEEIYNNISTGNMFFSDITVLDNGNSMKIDTNSSDASTWDDDFEKDEEQMGYLKFVNGCLGLPEALYEKMRMTPSASGVYEEVYEDIKVTWTYTAGKGFEVLYEKP